MNFCVNEEAKYFFSQFPVTTTKALLTTTAPTTSSSITTAATTTTATTTAKTRVTFWQNRNNDFSASQLISSFAFFGNFNENL